MAANVETMFYVREKPWHGLGTNVEEAPTSKEALIAAGLNWNVRGHSFEKWRNRGRVQGKCTGYGQSSAWSRDGSLSGCAKPGSVCIYGCLAG